MNQSVFNECASILSKMSIQPQDSSNSRPFNDTTAIFNNSQSEDLDDTKIIDCRSNLEETVVHSDETEEVFKSFKTSNLENLENFDNTQEIINTPSDDLVFHDAKFFEAMLEKDKASNKQENKRIDSLYVKFDPLYGSNMLPQDKNVEEKKDTCEIKNEIVKLSISQENVIPEEIDNNVAVEESVSIKCVKESMKIPHESNGLNEIKIVENIKTHCQSVEIDSEFNEKMRELETLRSIAFQQQEELDKVKMMNARLNEVIPECERIMAEKVEEAANERLKSNQKIQKLQEDLQKLQEDLQIANTHLNKSEAKFNDAHSKYENIKKQERNLMENEQKLKEVSLEDRKTIGVLEKKYQILKAHATERLETANSTLATIQKQHENEIRKEQSKVARAELELKSITETTEKQKREISELKKILDEIIAREDFTN